jgi:uncharacterized membrane protein
MTIDLVTFLVILGMAAVTYITRIAGHFLLSGRQFGPRMTVAFEALPPAVLTAVIAPSVLLDPTGNGLRALMSPEIMAAVITIIAAYRLPFLAVIVLGTASVVALRWLMT